MDARVNQMEDLEIREAVARGVRVLVREGLVPNAGHIAVRKPGCDWFWTPRHLHVGLEAIGPGDVIACDMKGESIDSPCDDVNVIAHFHPPMATVFSVTDQPIEPIMMLAAHIGEIPVYGVPEPVESHTDGLNLAKALGNAKAVLMRGHGAVTVGATVEDVCAIAVLMEESARTQFMAQQLGKVHKIDTKGREDVFHNAYVHFREVLWDHHTLGRENTPFLKRTSI